jgi:pyruvate/2-oxoglutarate dehydrogenase complex dihydrolipoamide dehydrogenase (E3) component
MPIFDVVVVGGGPSGEEASGRLADHGLSVALVEDRLVGAECVHWACMPSKALLRPYEALAEARRIPGAPEAVNGRLDVAAVLRRRDEIIGAPDDSALIPSVESHGITLVRGHGRIVDERRVMVGDEELEALRAVVLSVGSQPLVPAIDGLGDLEPGRLWTNRDATTTKEIPARMVVVGGGPEGVELAQAFQTLGSQVTLIEAQQHVLPRAEEFASAQATAALESTASKFSLVTRSSASRRTAARLRFKTSAGSTPSGDVVLMAVGRRPTTKDLGIEIVGLEPGALFEIDAHMRMPTVPWLYAVGDINGRALFTHMGRYEARVAVDHILGHEHAIAHGADGALAPHVTSTNPQTRQRWPHQRKRHPRGNRVRQLRHRHLRHGAAPRWRLLLRPKGTGHNALPGRPRAASSGRLHHRLGGRRLPACGDAGARRRDTARAYPPRRAAVPDPQRALALAARAGRRLRA